MSSDKTIAILLTIFIAFVLDGCGSAGNDAYIIPSSLNGPRDNQAEQEIVKDLRAASRSTPITLKDKTDAYAFFRPLMSESGVIELRKADITITDSSFQGNKGTLLVDYDVIDYESGEAVRENGSPVQLWVELQNNEWIITSYKVTP